MIKKTFVVASVAVLLAAVQPAGAITVTSLVGDKDGFGLAGAPAVPADGTLWQTGLGGVFFTDYRDAGDLANAPFTDQWFAGVGVSYTHSYSLAGLTAVSAQLSLQIAGVADALNAPTRGPWDVFANGTLLGQIPQNLSANAFQEIKIYNFNLPTALLSGSDLILLNINVPVFNDGYSINYSELKIEAAGGAVPDAGSTWLLLGAALASVQGLRRRLSAKAN